MTGTQIKIFLGFKDLGQSQSFSSDTSSTHSLNFLVGSGLFHSMLAAIPRDGHPRILQPLPSLVSRGLWHFPWCQAPASLHDAPPLSPRVSSQLRMYLYQSHLLASFVEIFDPVTQYQASALVHYRFKLSKRVPCGKLLHIVYQVLLQAWYAALLPDWTWASVLPWGTTS